MKAAALPFAALALAVLALAACVVNMGSGTAEQHLEKRKRVEITGASNTVRAAEVNLSP